MDIGREVDSEDDEIADPTSAFFAGSRYVRDSKC